MSAVGWIRNFEEKRGPSSQQPKARICWNRPPEIWHTKNCHMFQGGYFSQIISCGIYKGGTLLAINDSP